MEARLSFSDKHEIIYTYAADGRKLRAEYRINNFAVVDRDDEFGEMDDIGLPRSDRGRRHSWPDTIRRILR